MSEAPLETVPTRPQRRAQRRAELLDSTVALIRREGPLVSMDRIAAECGVTKPIIYRYFGDRDGLVKEVACRLVAEIGRELQGVLGPATSTRERLAATMDAFLAVVEKETNLYRFLNHHTSVERRDLFGRLIAEQFTAELEPRLRESALPAAAARPWAYALVGVLHFAGDWWTNERTMSRAELVDHLMVLVWDGLASLSPEPRP
jgi:AcrR family transcriptional regulator